MSIELSPSDPARLRRSLARELAGILRGIRHDSEDMRETLSSWTLAAKVRIAEDWLAGRIDGPESALRYSALAEAVIATLLPAATTGLAASHGRILPGSFAVLAFGKLGSGEMSAQSDLDLVCVYDVPEGVTGSDGMLALEVNDYYARLVYRLIAALSMPMASGPLYEVDIRLRPFGESGPTATSLGSLRRYYREDSWSWELMALTRARVIAGDAELGERLAPAIHAALRQERDSALLALDVAEMRRRIAGEHGNDNRDCKHRRGGLVDIEFIAQYLQLINAARKPGVLAQSTAQALSRLRDLHCLERNQAEGLLAAHKLWSEVQAAVRMQRALQDGRGESGEELFDAALSRVSGIADAGRRAAFVAQMTNMVAESFAAIIAQPAATVAPLVAQSESVKPGRGGARLTASSRHA